MNKQGKSYIWMKEKDAKSSSSEYEIPIGDNFKLNAKRKLGSGAFGDIYLGKQIDNLGVNLKLNEEVAIKLVNLYYL